jgi:hypothetical protein
VEALAVLISIRGPPGAYFIKELHSTYFAYFVSVSISSVFNSSLARKDITTTDLIIHNDSCHPPEHKTAAIRYLINRINTYPISKEHETHELQYTKTILNNNNYSPQTYQNAKIKINNNRTPDTTKTKILNIHIHRNRNTNHYQLIKKHQHTHSIQNKKHNTIPPATKE